MTKKQVKDLNKQLIGKSAVEIRKIVMSIPIVRLPSMKFKNKKRKTIKQSKLEKIADKSRIGRYSQKLKRNPPKSEIWFQDLWNKENIHNCEYNEILGNRIPDVINKKYYFIIEVDGNIHNTSEQKYKDAKKDVYYKSKGYQVFRVIAYDINSYIQCLKSVKKIINEYEPARISPVLEQGGLVANKV